MASYNDINMREWRNYSDIFTDSLWLIDKRDNSGAHNGDYHGNFVPQIPHQLLTRYTKKGDWILDPFAGSGTTIIEAQRMKRNAIGIELQKDVAELAIRRVRSEWIPDCYTNIITGDSKSIDLEKLTQSLGISQFQFILLHPPYWDIIKFSDDPKDISNTKSLNEFLQSLEAIIDNTLKYLEKNRYCAIVIGDKYANGQIIPLGFYCMELFLKKKYQLKAVLVKNFTETKGKSNKQGIWRYRALASDFYIFKHEYIFVFKHANK